MCHHHSVFANVTILTALISGCGSPPAEGITREKTEQSANLGRKETDLSVLLKKGMTPDEVIEKLEVTHFSVGPVIDLGTENIRYRAKALPGKVLYAEFDILKTGERLSEWKITDEEDYDDWRPIKAPKAAEDSGQENG